MPGEDLARLAGAAEQQVADEPAAPDQPALIERGHDVLAGGPRRDLERRPTRRSRSAAAGSLGSFADRRGEPADDEEEDHENHDEADASPPATCWAARAIGAVGVGVVHRAWRIPAGACSAPWRRRSGGRRATPGAGPARPRHRRPSAARGAFRPALAKTPFGLDGAEALVLERDRDRKHRPRARRRTPRPASPAGRAIHQATAADRRPRGSRRARRRARRSP